MPSKPHSKMADVGVAPMDVDKMTMSLDDIIIQAKKQNYIENGHKNRSRNRHHGGGGSTFRPGQSRDLRFNPLRKPHKYPPFHATRTTRPPFHLTPSTRPPTTQLMTISIINEKARTPHPDAPKRPAAQPINGSPMVDTRATELLGNEDEYDNGGGGAGKEAARAPLSSRFAREQAGRLQGGRVVQ